MAFSFLQARLWGLALGLGLLFFVLLRLQYGRLPGLRLLRILRTAGLGILLFMLLQPSASCTFLRRIKPEIAVLVDTSLSMAASTGSAEKESRLTAAIRTFEESIRPDLKDKFRFRYFAFGESLRAQNSLSSLTAGDERTDLSGALASFSRFFGNAPGLRGALLFSDGRFDLDAGAVEQVRLLSRKGTPVIPVPFLPPLSAAAGPDAAVRFDPDAAQEIYTGKKTSFAVELLRSPPDAAPLQVSFLANGKTVSQRSVRLPHGRDTVTFSYTAEREGLHELSVVIDPPAGDIFTANDSDTLFCRAVKGKYSTLLFSGRPSWEYAFLKRHLENDPSLEVTASVGTGKPGRLSYSSRSLATCDLIVLCGVAPADLPASFWSEALSRVKTGKTGLLLLAGSGPSVFSESSSSPEIRELLPFAPTADPPIRGNIFTEPTPAASSEPVMLLEDDPARNTRAWSGLPPLSTLRRIRPVPGTRILAAAKGSPSHPLMGFGPGGRHVFFIAGSPVWRWAFVNLPVNGDHERYGSFFRRLCRELTSDLSDAGRIQTDKAAYRKSETVRIFARLPAESGSSVSVRWEGSEKTSGLLPLRQNSLTKDRYEGSFLPDLRGAYKLSLPDGDATRFRVGREGAELFDVRPDQAALERLAGLAGVRPGEIASRFDAAVVERELTVRRDIWDSLIIILLLTGLLATEWILRKTRGLP